ncbi:MAG TPA: sigma-70 family RNA polymerase sigma factor [Pirellulaceae bacterium]|nr:sigma-70 family RNA polymerase sigma factor [Pirellulaceae bacterium]
MRYLELVTQSQRTLYGVLWSLLRDPHDVDDVLQETNAVLWQKAAEFDPSREFLPWALRIAQLQVMAFRKRQQRSRLVLDDELVAALVDQSVAEAESVEQRRRALAECLQKLNVEQRRLVVRRYEPGGSVNDLAAQQGRSPKAVSEALQETLDGGFPTNITLDQLLAKELGRQTLLPSLELSCNDFADNKETKYFESISWYGPSYAANTEKNPQAVFERLFGKPQSAATRSVLDVVLADAQALHRRLGRDDQTKLDEFLGSVREVEQRMERAEKLAASRQQPPVAQPAGIPEKRSDYLRLMADLMILAFQQDLTRVATLVVDPERWDSPRMYHDLFDSPQNHHVLTHTKGAEAKEKLARIDRFHLEFYADVVRRLAVIPEGDGTLLDSCCIAMGSGLSDGDSHNYRDLQVLLAGRAAGACTPGRHLHYAGNRPLADLWLTLGKVGGMKQTRFADSTGLLGELS